MPKQSFLKILLERRVPQIIGSYFITGTTLVFFIQYLVDKYQFPSHYPTLALFALIGIMPSVCIIAYFHGAPGKDDWTKIEKVGIPINVLFIATILFFGDSMNFWRIYNEDSSPTISLIHFTSLPEHIPHYKKHLTLNPNADLHPIDKLLLDSLRCHFSVQLYHWYFGQDKGFIIPKEDKEINYLNNHPLLSVDLEFTEERRDDLKFLKSSADSIYAKFNNPNHIAYFNIYKVSMDQEDYRYVVTSTRIWGNPDRGGNGAENSKVESISDILDNIKNQLKDLIGGASKKIGKVSEINDDIILVNLKDINVRRNMELKGTSTYDYGPGNSGYNNRLEDLKNAIDHIREKDGDGYNADLEFYNETYLALLADSLYCKYFDEGLHVGGCIQIRGQDYFLRVINVIDSVAVTKLIKFKYPWVKVRINDQVYVSIN